MEILAYYERKSPVCCCISCHRLRHKFAVGPVAAADVPPAADPVPSTWLGRDHAVGLARLLPQAVRHLDARGRSYPHGRPLGECRRQPTA